jgi:hypothetical protein
MKSKLGAAIERTGLILMFYAFGCWAPIWLRDTPWVIVALLLGSVLSIVGGFMALKNNA